MIASAARWALHPEWSPSRAGDLARALGVPPPFAQVLANRGMAEPEAARRFLDPAWEHLHDPGRLAGMERAVDRLHAAVAAGESVLVHGDYDVDGVTATFLMVSVLRSLGARVDYRIPHRTRDGYGLTPDRKSTRLNSSHRL